MVIMKIIYGKIRQKDGTYVEDKTMISRKFGKTLKACFTCKKDFTCTAKTLKECKHETKDNVVCIPYL